MKKTPCKDCGLIFSDFGEFRRHQIHCPGKKVAAGPIKVTRPLLFPATVNHNIYDSDEDIPNTPEMSEELFPPTEPKTDSEEELDLLPLEPIIDFGDISFSEEYDGFMEDTIPATIPAIVPALGQHSISNIERLSAENAELRDVIINQAISMKNIKAKRATLSSRIRSIECEKLELQEKYDELKKSYDDINYVNIIDFGGCDAKGIDIRIKRTKGARPGAKVAYMNRDCINKTATKFKSFKIQRDKLL